MLAVTLAILSGLIAGLLMFIGGSLLVRQYVWTTRHRLSLLAFAGGSLLSLSFSEFLPEAFLAKASAASLTLIATFSALFVLDLVFHPHFEEKAEPRFQIPVRWIVVGWWLHSFFDGVALGIVFASSVPTALLVAFGIMVHKFLDGVNAASLLISLGLPPQKVHFLLFSLSVGTPVGAWLSVLLQFSESPTFVAIRFALLGALFIYIASADILPQFHETRESKNILAFLSGMILFAVIHFLLPE